MTKSDVRQLLENSDAMVARALVTLYGRQTQDEQTTEDTRHRNHRGFNQADAGFLSSLAIAVHRSQAAGHARPLTAAQLTAARRQLLKYAGQLASIQQAEAADRKRRREAVAA